MSKGDIRATAIPAVLLTSRIGEPRFFLLLPDLAESLQCSDWVRATPTAEVNCLTFILDSQ